MMLSHNSRHDRGFTLTEVAIVLGIVGLVLGAIWVAAASVYDGMRLKRANEMILQVVQGMRRAYATSPSLGTFSSDTDISAGAARTGIIPKDMVINGYQGIHPWSSAGTIFRVYALPGGTAFALRFGSVPRDACATLLTQLTGSADGTGLRAVAVGGTAAPSPSGTPITQLGIEQTTVSPYCTGSTNTLWLTYDLKT